MKILLCSLVILLNGCSFKPQEETGGKNVSTIRAFVDLDGDGLSDDLEGQLGSSKTETNLARFSVNHFYSSEFRISDFAINYDVSVLEHDLDFNLIRAKAGVITYQNLTNIKQDVEPFGVQDLNIIPISHFTFKDKLSIQAELKKKESAVRKDELTIISKFTLKAAESKGLRKISNIKYTLGFVDVKNGKFQDIVTDLILISGSGLKVYFTSDGNADELFSAQDIFISLDRLENNIIEQFANLDNELAIKVTDFDYELIDGSVLKYSEVISNAQGMTSAVAYVDNFKAELNFTSRTDSLASFTGRYNVIHDRNGNVEEVGGQYTTAKFPVKFEELSPIEIKKSFWKIISETNSGLDHLQVGLSSLYSYLPLYEVAGSAKREIKDFDEEDLSSASFKLENLKLGENSVIKVKTLVTYSDVGAIYGASVSSYAHVETCIDERDRGCGGRCKKMCTRDWLQGWCGINLRSLSSYNVIEKTYQDKKFKFINLSPELFEYLNARGQMYFDESDGTLSLNLKVTDSFLKTFLSEKEELEITSVPDSAPKALTWGLMGLTDCAHSSRGNAFRFEDPGIRQINGSYPYSVQFIYNTKRSF